MSDIQRGPFSAYPEIGPAGGAERAMLRRVGSHRDPRRGDWRRRAGTGRRTSGVNLAGDALNRRRVAVAGVAAAAVLVVGGTHFLFTSAGAPASADLATRSRVAVQPAGSATGQDGATTPGGAVIPSGLGDPARTAASNPSAHPRTPAERKLPVPAGPTTRAGAPAGTSAPATTADPTYAPARRTASPTPTTTPTAAPTTAAPTPSTSGSNTPTPTPTALVQRPVTGTGTVVGIAGKCLSAGTTADDADPGASVQILGCDGSGDQVWTATDSTLRALGKCLDVADDSTGSDIRLSACDGSAGQHWQFVSAAIVNAQATMCVDVQGGRPDDGTPAIAATCKADPGQTWVLS